MANVSIPERLLDFISSSPTACHAVANLAEILKEQGFRQLHESESWGTLEAGKYFVTRQHATIAAFSLSDTPVEQAGLRMAGAHTDSPALKVKPQPEIRKHGMLQLGVEVYGGPLLSPWFDRDLSLAGRVSWSEEDGSFCNALLDFKAPLAIIPSLAIHLDRQANSKKNINPQTDIAPLLHIGNDEISFDELLCPQIIKENPQANPQQIQGHDLFFYDVQKPARIGLQGEFLSGARLDNLLSCFVLIEALCHAEKQQNAMVLLNNHEEVGSVSSTGAKGPFLKDLLKRLVPSVEKRQQMLSRSLLISTDNAHAMHPNFRDKYDTEHLPILNRGPVIKWNASQRYSTDAITGGFFRALCLRARSSAQDFVMRNDMACGSTIGPLTSAEIGIKTVDIGIPSLAMHSIRETVGREDILSLQRILQLFFSLSPGDPLWRGKNQ